MSTFNFFFWETQNVSGCQVVPEGARGGQGKGAGGPGGRDLGEGGGCDCPLSSEFIKCG
jgi:hypothetical protein